MSRSRLLLAALLACATITVSPPAQRPADGARAADSLTAPPQAGPLLRLKYAQFDPLGTQPTLPAALTADTHVGLWIVQLHGTPTDEDRAAVTAAGGELHGYLPDHAYVVRMSAGVAAAVAGLARTRYVGRYQPAFRLEPELVAAIAAGGELPKLRYNVVVVDKRKDKPLLEAGIAAAGGRVVDALPGSLLMEVDLTGAQLLQVARLDQVLWIDRWSPPETDMDNARIQGGADYVESLLGYTGAGVRGHVYEGVEWDHPDFTTPMTNVLSSGGADSHGHATAGIVFGNGGSNPAVRGMAPDAIGFYTQYSTANGSRNAILGAVVNTHQCMFTTSSWGGTRTTQYTSVSADADDIIFDHRIPWTQSQSNAGNQQSRPQAWAKNIFSIGGVRHFDNADASDDSWAAGGASTGPAADGRIKPDLCAYYDSIGTSDLTGSAGYSSGDWTSSFGGTSGATPIVAGHNAIAIQMYTDGLFGNPLPLPGGTRFQNRPLAQTLKAIQIANARQYAFTQASGDNRREHCGWGFPSLRNLYDNRDRIYIVPEDDVLAPGTSRVHEITVAAGQPELKVCMTFLDPAGNPAAALAIVNDLDLRVTSPGGTVYWGNQGLTQGNYSTPGGSPDTVDTVENVFVQQPAAGVWRVEVIASQLVQDAHVATAAVDATYALCCVGGTGAVGGSGSYASATPFGTGCSGGTAPALPQTFYEVFGSFDLAGSGLRLQPDGSGGWSVSSCTSCWFSTIGNNLSLGDDELSSNHALGFSFPLPGGGSTTAIDIDSNGWIGLVAGAHAGSDYTESVGEFLGDPARIAGCWDDLNPAAAGAVFFDVLPGMAVVTWSGVPEWSSTGSNTFQLQLFPSGELVLAYQSMTVADALVGYSTGGGVTDPGGSDLSQPSAPPLSLAASALPAFGGALVLDTSDYPAGTLLGFQALGLQRFDPGIDLTPQGMPGCWQYTGFDALDTVAVSGGQSTYSLPIPNDTSFQGLPLNAQSYAFAPGVNAVGVLSSNGVAAVVGN